MIERISSGIAGMDNMIEGGFVKNSTVLVTGGCGSGKTTFAMQFLYEGAKAGERGVYITFEEEPAPMKDNFSTFGWDLDKLEKEKLLEILHIRPPDVLRVSKEGITDLIEDVTKIGAQRVVIDSISSVEMLIHDEYKRREALIQIMDWLRGNSCTSIMIAEAEQDPNQYTRHGVVEFVVDGVVVLYNFRQKSARHRALEVLKMRGTKHMTKMVPFIMKDGIELMPKQHLFGEV